VCEVFPNLCEDQKKIILLQCSHFFPKKNCQNLGEKKIVEIFSPHLDCDFSFGGIFKLVFF
jgi:hypothetical protein